jgi:two-component system, response regulator, stage 0 sporulation protein F
VKKRILLVEDEQALRLLYEEELTLKGYEVTAFAEVEAAPAALKAANFNLIVTDIRIPGKNGIDFITTILGLRKDIPIIINSAYESYKEEAIVPSERGARLGDFRTVGTSAKGMECLHATADVERSGPTPILGPFGSARLNAKKGFKETI